MPRIDVKPHEIRIRSQDPSKFDPRSLRYHYNRSGRSAELVGCPKGHYNAKSGRCRVGTQVQSYRLKREYYPNKPAAKRWLKKNVCTKRPRDNACRLLR